MANFNFQMISCKGITPPKLSFHSCSLVGDIFYIYGGVDDKKQVQNRLLCFEPSTCVWSEVECCFARKNDQKASRFNAVDIKEAPRLSHHTATVLNDRYIAFIGGWTGHKRTSDVFYFDTAEKRWSQAQIKGDIPAGLSSHTATLVSEQDVIIVGREGGVRTQRRSGDSFYYNLKTSVYTDALLHVSSRSGHTANLIRFGAGKTFKILIQGGRKGSECEMIGSWAHKPTTKTPLEKDKIDRLLASMVACEQPKGRQHCISVELSDRYLLFFGGETWSGVRNNISNESYVHDCHSRRWYCAPCGGGGCTSPCLTGHAMGMVQDKVFIFGGLLDGKCSDIVWMVQL